tara:strand:- start:19 stop:1170 length:1152 start_codon:yes stop_codon:yes gene_type:complete
MSRTTLGHSLGGMQKQTMDLCEGFVKSGHKVTLVTTGREDNIDHEVINGVEIFYLAGSKPSHYSKKWNKLARKKLAELHQHIPFDVIHSQSMGANGILKWAKANSIPVVSTWHGTNMTELSAYFSTTSYNPRYWHWLVITPITLFRRYLAMELPIRKASEAITLVSPTLENHMKKHATGKVITIPNGVFIPELMEPKFDLEIVDIISIGRLVKQKGVQHAINGVASLPENLRSKVHLNIVGEGPYLKDLKQLSSSLGMNEYVTFHGRMVGDTLANMYKKCLIHLMPTTSHEGLPLTILEGMSYGLVTIASDIGGIPSLITHNKDGFLISPGNSQELAQSLEKLMIDRTLMQTLSKSARSTIIEGYSMEKMVNDTLQVLVEAVG